MIEVWERLDSTNAEAVRDPAPWRVVVAEEQSHGRGRLTRSWTTVRGSALAVSAVVPLSALADSGMPLGWLPLAAGLAVVEAVADACGARVGLKWPNDVLVPSDDDRKLAGILCEWTPAGVVVGVGINVDTPRAGLPLDTATSLRACGHPGVAREVLLTAYLARLAVILSAPEADRRRAYRERCLTLGRTVRLHEPGGGIREGRATSIDETGRLVLQTADGTYAVTAGDVVHVREVQ